MRYFTPPPPRILAHRGLAHDAPENTLAAFEAAARMGVTHIETDAHITRDGYAVLWHDSDLARWNETTVRLADLTLAQLRTLQVNGHTISTVAEALREFPKLCFNIDVKVPDAACAVAEDVHITAASDRVLLTSFSDRIAVRLRRLLPEAAHGAATARIVKALTAHGMRCQHIFEQLLQGSHAVQLPQRALGLDLASAQLIQAWHRAVREVHVWTVNDPEQMTALFRRGVDGIVTDFADVGIQIVRGLLAE